jgi:hypothetical protein
MNGWNSALLLSGSTEHFSGATTGGRARNCKEKYDAIFNGIQNTHLNK